MANERQCIILNTLHNVTQFTIKHSSYKNATTGYLMVSYQFKRTHRKALPLISASASVEMVELSSKAKLRR